jgi:hypothetical protein
MRWVFATPLVFALAGTASGRDTAPQKPVVPAAHGILPFIEDDYSRALSEARSRKLPLFVDAWAPW